MYEGVCKLARSVSTSTCSCAKRLHTQILYTEFDGKDYKPLKFIAQFDRCENNLCEKSEAQNGVAEKSSVEKSAAEKGVVN